MFTLANNSSDFTKIWKQYAKKLPNIIILSGNSAT